MMGLITRAIDRQHERRSACIEAFLQGTGGGMTNAGVSVGADKALGLTAVWSAINRIASTMAMLPLHIMETTKDGKEYRPDHPVSRLLRESPNEYETVFDWRYCMAAAQLLHGAGISKIEFDGHGFPVALKILDTKRVTPKKTAAGQLVYEYQPERGGKETLQPHELLIFRMWPLPDGAWIDPIAKHKETLGAAIAVREYGARTFGQGINPVGVVSGAPKGLTEEARKSFLSRFEGYSGLGQSRRLMFLEGEEKFERIGIEPESAQYLETRRFDIAEVARIYNIPLFLMNEMEKSSSWGSGIAQMSQAFVTFVMQRYVVQWEMELNKKLVSVDKPQYYAKFTMEGMLRSNTNDRMAAYEKGARLGIYSVDEIREMEDLNPLKGEVGAARLVPMNFSTLEKAVAGDGDE